jgi:fumarate reductase flavoprotein subunit
MKRGEKDGKMSRRSFIKGTAAGLGALSLMKIGVKDVQAAPPPMKWDREVNILILGAGAAGCMAAITAKDAGESDILIVEKWAYPGGAAALSSGTILAAGTVLQKDKGISDSKERWFDDIMKLAKGGVNPEIVKVITDNALDIFNFLYDAGMRWSNIDPLPGYTADRCYREASGGAKLMRVVLGEVKKRNVEILLETRATKLYVDSCGGAYPQGEVLGAECVGEDGKVLNIKARKGVLIATGDFSSDPKYIESHFPQMKGVFSVGHPGNTGDGIKLAQKLGADITGYFPYGSPHCVEISPGKALLWCRYDLLSRNGLILVNKAGKRFCDEVTKGHYTPLLPEVQSQEDGFFACMFDEAIANNIKADERFKTNFRGHEKLFIDGLKGDGFVIKKANTIPELAKKLGINPDGLAKTIAAYNEGVSKKKDEFNRDPKFLVRIGTPPFYGWKGAVGIAETRGGLRMDARARVLDPYLKPIPRLYVAGHAVGGYTNETSYRSGWHLTNALVYGRIAIKEMLAAEPWA